MREHRVSEFDSLALDFGVQASLAAMISEEWLHPVSQLMIREVVGEKCEENVLGKAS